MALQILIPGIRCNEETDGVGDDEIVVIAAALPVDTNEGLWTYADRYTDCQYRFLPDVSTGDAYEFGNQVFGPDGPIEFTQEAIAGRAVEVWLYIGEVDGGGSTTAGQASDGWETFYATVAALARPGTPVGGPNRTWRQPGLDTRRIQTIGFDIFTVNMAQPLAGTMDPQYLNRGEWQITAPSGADQIYQNPKDGWFSETRTYRDDDQNARYTLEVEYRAV